MDIGSNVCVVRRNEGLPVLNIGVLVARNHDTKFPCVAVLVHANYSTGTASIRKIMKATQTKTTNDQIVRKREDERVVNNERPVNK